MDVIKIKELGNQHFAKKEYERARELYSQGLEMDPQNEILLANRSAAYLMLENFEAALEDAQKVLISHPNYSKIIFRAAKAFCGLSRYREAATTLKSLIDPKLSMADKKTLQNLLEKVENYIKQSERGEYNFLELLGSYDEGVMHDVADFFGPLKIVNIPGKGRGVVSSSDIQQGQLLILSKAFAISFENMDNSTFLKEVVKVLEKHPEKKKDLYKLYSGPELGFLDPDVSESYEIDANRIYEILKYNCFACFGKGLWIEPSFINNDCGEFNSIFCDYGNVMVIRAIRPIKAGEEVLVTYTKNRYSYLERKKIIWDAWGFECTCDLCQTQKSEEPKLMGQRGALLEYFRRKSSSYQLNVDELKMKSNQLERLCEGYSDYYFKMFTLTPMYVLAMAYGEMNLRKSTEILKDLADNTELNYTDKLGPYGFSGEFRNVLSQLMANLAMLDDIENGKKYFPMIMENFEIIEGKVGVKGYKLRNKPILWSFIDDISEK